MSTLNSDSLAKLEARYLDINLGKEFGRRLVKAYNDDPSSYASPEVFAAKVFPGFYFANEFGSGRIGAVAQTSMRIHFHKTFYSEAIKKDTTTYNFADYFLVTPEVVSTNNLTYVPAASLKSKIEAGEIIATAPLGYGVEVTFPAPEIIASYRAAKSDLSIINSLTLTIPTDTLYNDYNVAPASYMLLVLKNKRDEFFINNQLADNKTSFYATYDNVNHEYSFPGLRQYLLDLMEKESLQPEDYTFDLCPVQVDFEAQENSYGSVTYVESSMTPYVTRPAMTKFDIKNAKIKFTYSLQSKKNY